MGSHLSTDKRRLSAAPSPVLPIDASFFGGVPIWVVVPEGSRASQLSFQVVYPTIYLGAKAHK